MILIFTCSENILGGIYSLVLFIIFHKNNEQIYTRPLGRENFAFPFILVETTSFLQYLENRMKTQNMAESSGRIFLLVRRQCNMVFYF